ncbi:MAG: glycosyltransferase family 4 protein [Candidatus Promineifilaceae bacterium]
MYANASLIFALLIIAHYHHQGTLFMRILVITNYYPPFEQGGWGQLTYDVVQQLKSRGHEVLVLTSQHRRDELPASEEGVERTLFLESPDHIHYKMKYTLAYRREEAANKRIVAHCCRKFAPDVVYVNGMWNLPVCVAQTAESCLPGRVAYYMASYWPAEQDAHSAFWQDLPDGWKRLPKQLVGRVLVNWWLKPAARNQLDFRVVMCVSDYLRRRIVAEAGIPEERTRVVYNGIDLADFPLRPLPAHTNNPRTLKLLYAGRFHPDKGVHTIIESLGHLWQQTPSLPISVTLVGKGTPAYEEELRNLVQKLGVAKWIIFKPFVAREKMPAILREHDALIFPSIWPEPLARMVQEAMASGLIVIGTTTGGTPEILQDGRNGLTFTAGDATMLTEKILWLTQNQDQWQNLAQTARKTVEQHFTLSRMVNELEVQFNQLIQAKVS